MGTPVLTVPASPPPTTPPANHVCHRLCCQVHWSRRCHRRCCRVRSWNWLRLRFPHHRIRQEPLPQAAAVLLRHSWLCPCSSPSKYRLCRMSAFSPRGAIVVSPQRPLYRTTLQLTGLFCSFM